MSFIRDTGVNNIQSTHKRGMGLVEIIVGVSILSLILIGIVSVFHAQFRAGLKNTKKIQAAYLMEEGIEAVRFMRDSGWTASIASLTVDTPYFLTFDGSVWGTTVTETLIDGVFRRTVELGDVYRQDVGNDIEPDGAVPGTTLDPNTKKVTSSVSWDAGANVASTTMYITNLFQD